MGWAGYFEDNWDRLQDSFATAQKVLDSKFNPAEEQRRVARQALGDAQVVLKEIFQHLDLATTPELDLAHQIQKQKVVIFSLKSELQQVQPRIDILEKENLKLTSLVESTQNQLDKIIEENVELRSKNSKLESPEHWQSQMKKYLSSGAIKKVRNSR